MINYFFSSAGFFSDDFLSSPSFLSPLAPSAAGFSPSAAAVAPSAPSAPTSPSAVSASAGFSGYFITVGAARVAITKSLPWIVGVTSESNFTDEILKLSPMSIPSRFKVKLSGIFSLGHFNSTFLLTIFKTPPLFKPGDLSWLIKFTGTSIFIFTPGKTLKKSTWVGSSLNCDTLPLLVKHSEVFRLH